MQNTILKVSVSIALDLLMYSTPLGCEMHSKRFKPRNCSRREHEMIPRNSCSLCENVLTIFCLELHDLYCIIRTFLWHSIALVKYNAKHPGSNLLSYCYIYKIIVRISGYRNITNLYLLSLVMSVHLWLMHNP